MLINQLFQFYPSICPFSAIYPGPGHSVSRLSKVVHTSLFLAMFQLLLAFPDQTRYDLSSLFRVCPVVSYQLDMPRKPPKASAREAS